MKKAVSRIVFGFAVLAAYGAQADDRDYSVRGECGGVAAEGIISFRDVGAATLVRERLVLPTAPTSAWSDRIGLIAASSDAMTDNIYIALTDTPEAEISASRTYKLNGDKIEIVTQSCNLVGNVRSQVNTFPMDVIVSTAIIGDGQGNWKRGYKPTGQDIEELRFQFDRFGAIVMYRNASRGTACIGEAYAEVERKISDTQAVLSINALPTSRNDNCFLETGTGNAVLNKGTLTIKDLLPSRLPMGKTGEADRIQAALKEDYLAAAANPSSSGGPKASGPWPAPISITGGLDEMSIDTSGVSLTMSIAEIQRLIGGKITPYKWNFFNAPGLEPKRLNREDIWTLSASNTNANGAKTRIVVTLSRWHTGNRPLKIDRSTEYKENKRPTEANFLKALAEKYGEGTQEAVRRFGKRALSWKFAGGSLSADCKQAEVPNNLKEAYGSGKIAVFENILNSIDSEALCGGRLNVNYSVDAAKRIEEFTLTLLDIRALVADSLNGRQVKKEMQEFFLNAASEGTLADPDL